MIFLCPAQLPTRSFPPSSSSSLILWLSPRAVQLTVPIGNDGQLMSGAPPILWPSTHAVQLAVPMGDDGR